MRIVHFADLHLGIKQYGMPERHDDFLVAAAYVFHRAIELKADVVHLGGDVFHSLHPQASEVYFLYQQVQAARAAGIRVVGVDGNHDCVESAWLKIIGVEPLARFEQGSPVATVIGGVSFFGINGGRVSNIRADLDRLATNTFGRLDVLSMHLPLAEMAGFEGVEMSCREIADKVAPLGVRIVLLGDIHDYKETVIGGVRFVYSGSTEMTAANENPDKTFSIVEIDAASLKTSVERIPVRPVLHYRVDGEADLDTLLANINSATADPRRPPMAMVTYDSSVVGLRQKIELLLKGRALARVVPAGAAAGLDVFGALVAKENYERKGAMRNLREVVAGRFGPESDEFKLIVDSIEKPDEVDHIMLQYARSRGLDVK